jgi:hypothetical protein
MTSERFYGIVNVYARTQVRIERFKNEEVRFPSRQTIEQMLDVRNEIVVE